MTGIMHFDGQKTPLVSDLGEAIAVCARRRWPSNTSGNLAQSGKISKDKAANILKGHASGKTVAQLFRTLGMDFALEVIEITVGERLDAHLERETRKAKQRELHIETTRERLAASHRRHAVMGDSLRNRMAG